MAVNKFKFEKLAVKSLGIYLIITILVGLVSFYLGIQLGQPSTLLPASQNNQSCSNDLELCLTDQATSETPQKEKSNLAFFGIYSPLFENKEVEYQAYIYRKNAIEKRTVQVELENDSIANVTTWKLMQPVKYLPDLPERLRVKRNPTDLTYKLFDFPIFDGYEFQTIVSKEKFVSARIPENPSLSDIYTSEKGIKMYRSRLSCPKAYCGAELHFLTTVDDGKTQMVVQISGSIKYLGLDISEIESGINQKFRELEKIADTLDFETY